nr:phosphatase PAP2 family protein [Oscillospiraceae bacterium]
MSFDLPILEWIRTTLWCDALDVAMPIITMFGDAGIFWIACSVLLLLFPKTRKTGLGMGFALILGLLICNVTLKPMVARIRPYDLQAQLGVTINLLNGTMHDFSFPSGHTIASFEAAVVLLKNSKKMGIPAMILAVLIAFSRLYLYVHYPTDVIASILLGTLFAFIGNALAGLIAPKLRFGKRGKYEA